MPNAVYESLEDSIKGRKILTLAEQLQQDPDAQKYFKRAITKEQWEQTAKAVREPLGKTVCRQLKSQQYATTLPGAPDGEYVVIQFDSSFTNKKTAVETITPMLDKDGMWRVSGYYIK